MGKRRRPTGKRAVRKPGGRRATAEVPAGLIGGTYTISKDLRRRVVQRLDEGMPLLRLAAECGVKQPSLWRFVFSGQEAKAGTIDRLAVYFGLRLGPQ